MQSQQRLSIRFGLAAGFVALATVIGSVVASPSPITQEANPDPPGTFSILGYDPQTGEIGAAVQSRVFSVGNGVLWAEAGVGAVATQAYVDVGYGPRGIELLKQGLAPKAIIEKILAEDPDTRQGWPKAGRQFAVINAKGELAAYSGPRAPLEFGDAQGKFCTAQGNTLGRPGVKGQPPDPKPSMVPAAMVEGFEKSEVAADGRRNHLSTRLVAALEAGQAAGGDHRGQQSAALIVVKKDCGVWSPHNDVVLRLQVDDNPEPIVELRRLVEKAIASRLLPCLKR